MIMLDVSIICMRGRVTSVSMQLGGQVYLFLDEAVVSPRQIPTLQIQGATYPCSLPHPDLWDVSDLGHHYVTFCIKRQDETYSNYSLTITISRLSITQYTLPAYVYIGSLNCLCDIGSYCGILNDERPRSNRRQGGT